MIALTKTTLGLERFAILIALFVVAALPLAATGLDEASDTGAPLRIAYPKTVSSIPLIAVVDAYPDDYVGEFYADHPLALARLLAGELDVIATGFSFGLARYMSDGDLVHVQTPVWGVSALMTGTEIDALSDLAGETIYAPLEGSPIDIYLREILEEAGLTEEISIAYAPFPQSSALVAQGEVAAAVLVEPIASTLELSGRAFRFENIQDGWARIAGGEPRSPQVSLFALTDAVETMGDLIRQFERRVDAQTILVAEDPAAAAAAYASALEFPEQVVANALTNALFDAADAPTTQRIVENYARIIGVPEPGEEFFLAEGGE